ncbi:hypothetical protein [Allorhizocola rhizosphaerae]|uniref:hypothetical protein n=1 Tax=Allorhizocola rhizosphaerae TaxID=1872709 RepID=UPI000E3E56A1|nr:hypothetical protein [Allorhizocola rhizosphaerae]
MSGDVVDFAPVPRPRKWTRPSWQTGSAAVPLAVLGAALGAASLFGEWTTITMPNGVETPAIMLSSVGSLGTAFVVALMALVTVVAIALFGEHPGGTRNQRVAGIALSGGSLVLLGAIANMLTAENQGRIYLVASSLSSSAQAEPTASLAWGVYAAFGAVIALGGALLLPAPVRRTREVPVEEEPEFEGEAVDLTVTVEPVRGPGR